MTSLQDNSVDTSFNSVSIGGDTMTATDAQLSITGNALSGFDESNKMKTFRKHHCVAKIFQDSVSVFIPIDVRVDLKIAIEKTRQKRIKSIHKRFPSLKKEAKKAENRKEDSILAEDEEDEANQNSEKKDSSDQQQKNRNNLTHVPQREQYGSVVDYLEAKYVRGVQLGDEDEEEIMDDVSEGQGSVYSKGSFLDDTDLQRDVAEQVMANTTMTKLELEENDADFFVNVGNLEVEDNEYGDQYDPLQDKDSSQSNIKKRKKSASQSAPAKKPKKSKTTGPNSAKSQKSTASSASMNTNKKATSNKTKFEDTDDTAVIAEKLKTTTEKIFKTLVAMIKRMTSAQVPRRKTKLKVALTCPQNKKAGDPITFQNPHNPGQRLRVQVPKDCAPGCTFKVAVPVKQPEEDGGSSDQNKLPKDFKDLLDDYARAHDEWCRAQAEVDKDFALFKEKQKKFDRIAKVFPSALVTPINSDYLKKVVRRVRQYKLKKKKVQELKRRAETPSAKNNEESDREEEQEKEVHRTLNIPTTGVEFPSMKWKIADFSIDDVE